MASSQLSLFSKGLISSTYCIISSEDDLTKGETHASTNLMKCFVSPANKLNRCSKVYVRSQSSLLIKCCLASASAFLKRGSSEGMAGRSHIIFKKSTMF